jgi:hypothetical protein
MAARSVGLHRAQPCDERLVAVEVRVHAAEIGRGHHLGRVGLGRFEEPPRAVEVVAHVLQVGPIEEVVLLEPPGLLDLHRVAVGRFEEAEAPLESGDQDPGADGDRDGEQHEGEEGENEARADADARPLQERTLAAEAAASAFGAVAGCRERGGGCALNNSQFLSKTSIELNHALIRLARSARISSSWLGLSTSIAISA